jgi:hypothetical protein
MRTPEERYRESLRKQQQILEEFAAREIEWTDDLLLWYRLKKLDMPDDQYRTVAFFKNQEYLTKPGVVDPAVCNVPALCPRTAGIHKRNRI